MGKLSESKTDAKERGGEVPFAEMKEWVAGAEAVEVDRVKRGEAWGSVQDVETLLVPYLHEGETPREDEAISSEDDPEASKSK